jgi:hypothetical protein
VAGIYLKHGDSYVAMAEKPYDAEDILQALIQRHPEMLASEDTGHGPLLLVKREAPATDTEEGAGRWSLDHLYLDAQWCADTRGGQTQLGHARSA